MAGVTSPAPTPPASHIHLLLPPACRHHIARPPYRRPQPEWSGINSPILTTPLSPIPPQVPRRHPGNCPGLPRPNSSSTYRRPQPRWPASLPLPPRRRHPEYPPPPPPPPPHGPPKFPGTLPAAPNPPP